MSIDTITDGRDAWTDRLSEYLDEELSPAEHAALEGHLQGCAACRTLLEELRRVTVRARALRDRDPGPAVWPGIARRIGAPGVVLDAPDDELAARRRRVRSPWLWMGAAAAAMLVLGIGIGRFTVGGPHELPEATVAPVAPDPYRLATVQHLGRTEAMLTAFRAEAAAGAADPAAATWANDLLTQTRLLLDSPAANDPKLRTLLEDLELVLVQIAQLPHRNPDNEVDLAQQAIEESRVLPRMRTLVPAGSAATQGES